MNNKTTTKQRVRYQKVSRGVYMYITANNKPGKNTYRVIKTIEGERVESYFTNKTKAINFYKGLK